MSNSDPVCAVLGIPDHLHQCGRKPDHVFAEEEQLFVRCKPTETQIKNVISFRRQSCNRARYCEGGPSDVLYDSERGGNHQEYTAVVAITVAAVQEVLAEITEQIRKHQPQTKRNYSLQPQHRPEQCNYAHAEIVAYCNGVEDPENIKPSSMKKRLREQLVERYRFVLPSRRNGERLESD